MNVPRKPGSQVAPGQKPLHAADRQTAHTHSRQPLDQLTEGRTYRVRDKDFAVIWGEGLSWDDAVKLKEKVVGARRSKTARVEDEETPVPDWAREPQHQRFIGGRPEPRIIERDGASKIATKVAGSFMDFMLGHIAPNATGFTYGEIEAFWYANLHVLIAKIDDAIAQATSAAPEQASTTSTPTRPPAASRDGELEHMRAAARHAAQMSAAESQRRHTEQRRQQNLAELANLPKPPPSPLTDKVVEDIVPNELPPDDEILDEASVADLLGGVGGPAGDDDVERAKAQAAKDQAEIEAKAKALYATDGASHRPGVSWAQLSEQERAAWRFEAMTQNTGAQR
jgi:hypothetical protein